MFAGRRPEKRGVFGVFWDPGNGRKYGILSLKQGYFRGQNKAYFGAILGVWPAGGRNWAYFGVILGPILGLFV